MACVALLGLGWLLAARAQRELDRVAEEWDAWQSDVSARGLAALDRELDATIRSLARSADAALAAPAERESAFSFLEPLIRGSDERSVTLYRGDSAFAWSGELRPSPDALRDSVGVSASEFYLTLYATARRDNDHAVATVLLSAAPPADRLSRPLAQRIAQREGLDDFRFSAPGRVVGGGGGASGQTGPVLRFAIAGRPLLEARAAPLAAGEVAYQQRERARIEVGALLLLSLACFIIAAWRETRALHWRLATLGVTLAASAMAPLNQLSNLTRLFDPAVYFTPLGGALTANAGALLATSAIALLALLTMLRRGRPPSRWTAAVVVLLVAGLGPFLLRDLARGIKPPSYGVSAPLWLIWQIPLFLAAVSVLLAGAGAGGAMLGRSRGLPAYVAPVLAAVASFLAPIVWEAPGQWRSRPRQDRLPVLPKNYAA